MKWQRLTPLDPEEEDTDVIFYDSWDDPTYPHLLKAQNGQPIILSNEELFAIPPVRELREAACYVLSTLRELCDENKPGTEDVALDIWDRLRACVDVLQAAVGDEQSD